MSVEDRLAILDAMGRYSHTYYEQDAAAWANMFTPDGVFEMFPHGATEPSSRMAGRDMIEQTVARGFAARGAGARVHHAQVNTSFAELTPTTARTVSTMIITRIAPPDEQLQVTATGVYRDQWAKIDGEWKIARRSLHMDRT